MLVGNSSGFEAPTFVNGIFASAFEGKQPTNIVALRSRRLFTSTSRGPQDEICCLSDEKRGSIIENIDASSMEVARTMLILCYSP